MTVKLTGSCSPLLWPSIISPGKDRKPKHKVRFLLNAYFFHAIIKSRTTGSWRLSAPQKWRHPLHPSNLTKPFMRTSLSLGTGRVEEGRKGEIIEGGTWIKISLSKHFLEFLKVSFGKNTQPLRFSLWYTHIFKRRWLVGIQSILQVLSVMELAGGAWSAEGPLGPVTRAALGPESPWGDLGDSTALEQQLESLIKFPSLVEKSPWLLMAHSTSVSSPTGTRGALGSSAAHPLTWGVEKCQIHP